MPLRVLAETEKSSTKIWADSVVDQYELRPDHENFTDMCLVEFVADYTKNTGYKVKENHDNVPSTSKKNISGETFKLKSGKCIKKRSKRAIIRYYKVRQDIDPERYFKNIMRLYLPHATLNKPVKYETYEYWFNNGSYKFKDGSTQNICDVVYGNMEQFERYSPLMEDCWQQCQRDNDEQEDGWATIAPSAEEDRVNQHEEKQQLEEIAAEYVEEEDVTVSFPDSNTEQNDSSFVVTKTNIVEDYELRKMIRQMNSQQYELLMYVRSWCLKHLRNEHPEPFYVHLTGSAGCGKSHLVRTIYQLVTKYLTQLDEECGEIVFLSAFQGSAAFNIDGYTLHSLFSIPVNAADFKDLKGDKLIAFQKRLANIRLLIIDEISLVSRTLFDQVHSRMKQLKGLSTSPHAPFGNTSVLTVGDYFQLPSVASTVICKKMYDNCDYLWSQFVLYRLEEIIRQKGDTGFGETLNEIRIRKREHINRTSKENKTERKDSKYEYEPLSENTQALLKSRKITYAPELPGYPKDVVHLFARNEDVDRHNNRILQLLCPNYRTIKAADTQTYQRKTGRLAQPIEVKEPKAYQLPELHIGEGARIILKLNLDVSDGLCNGATGRVVKIYDGKMPRGQPEVLFIQFDSEKVGKKLRMNTVYPKGIPTNTVPIKPHSGVLRGNTGKKTVRYQFPVTLAWATTIHISQGQTLQKAVVSFKDIDYPGQIYVALSRVTSSEGLYIIDLDLSKIYCDSNIQECYNAMTKLETNMPKVPETHTLTVVHQNVEGLREHISDLQRCNQLQPSDVICVTETWNTTNNDIQLSGYSYLGRTRRECYPENCEKTAQLKLAKNGGVGMFLAKSLTDDRNIEIADVSNHECALEHMALNIHDSKKGITSNIIVLYRPQKVPPDFACIQLAILLESLPASSRNILVGDLNEDASKGDNQPLERLMTNYGFTQLIQEPTTIGMNGATLDHVYVKSKDGMVPDEYGVIPTHFSYHEAVYVSY